MMLIERTIRFKYGFTLLELLVAIALMDVIALTLYSSMYIGFRTKRNSKAKLEPYHIVTPAFEYIRKDLSNVLKPDGILAGMFVGEDIPWENRHDADTFSFFMGGYQPAEDEIASNVINVEYVIGKDEVRKQIVLKRLTTKNLLSPTAVEPEEEVVCRGLAGFDIKYYDGTIWLDSWDSSEHDSQLPMGVRVTLTILKELDNPLRDIDYDLLYKDYTRTFMLASMESETSEESAETGGQNG